MKNIWQIVRRISGKSTPAALSHLKINNTTIERPTEIANIIASTIACNSSSDHYTDSFQRLSLDKKNKKLNSPQITRNHIIYLFLKPS